LFNEKTAGHAYRKKKLCKGFKTNRQPNDNRVVPLPKRSRSGPKNAPTPWHARTCAGGKRWGNPLGRQTPVDYGSTLKNVRRTPNPKTENQAANRPAGGKKTKMPVPRPEEKWGYPFVRIANRPANRGGDGPIFQPKRS